jgi:antitoxin HicB
MTQHRLKYLIEIFWSEEDLGYIAVAPDLPGCSAFGETFYEVGIEMGDAMESWLQACAEMNRPIPEPKAQPQPNLAGIFANMSIEKTDV